MLSMGFSRTNPPPGVRYQVEAWIAKPYRVSRIERVRRWFIVRWHRICAALCWYFQGHEAHYVGVKYPATGQTWTCWCGRLTTNVCNGKPYEPFRWPWMKRVQ
jgi:hypothetical protein